MNVITQYIAYLKDNPQRYWFKRRLYGWGWTPARWQGWVVIAVFLVFVLMSALDMSARTGDGEFGWLFFRILIAVIVLTVICYKTGEKPHWMWGPPKN